jgi:hypothetical protein
MSENVPPNVLKFHYIKGNFFRVIHADGAIGGLTPNHGIFLSLFSERGAIPQVIEQAINADGSPGEPKVRAGKDGLVREIEVGVMLNGRSAKGIAEWLLKQVQVLEASEPEQGMVSSSDANPVEELP